MDNKHLFLALLIIVASAYASTLNQNRETGNNVVVKMQPEMDILNDDYDEGSGDDNGCGSLAFSCFMLVVAYLGN